MRFSLKDLFWATTLIAMGAACWPMADYLFGWAWAMGSSWIYYYGPRAPGFNVEYEHAAAVFLLSAALIGGGLAAPFHRKKVGASLRVLLGLTLLFSGCVGAEPVVP